MNRLCYTLTVKSGIFKKKVYKYISKEDAISDGVKFLRKGDEVKIN